ncbi:MAG: DUF4968 domain-containing protein [Colwellia sp.]
MHFIISKLKKNTIATLLTITALVISVTAQANVETNDRVSNSYISHKLTNNALVITTDLGKVKLTAYSDEAIEVHYQYESTFTKGTEHLPSFSIKERSRKASFSVINDNSKLVFSGEKLEVVIEKSPFKLSFFNNKGENKQLLVAEESGFFIGKNIEQSQVLGFRFSLASNEKLLGGGERVLGMDRRGHRMPLYNRAHYAYTTKSNQMNFGIPAVMSSNKYILLFDNSAKGWMDLGKTEKNIMQFEAVAGRTSYLIFSGDTYPELIHNYVDITGKQPLPPRWAFGNYASRFGYRTEQEVRSTVNKFIELDFPLDALIIDLYWFGKDIQGHMGNLAWDKEAFPTPTKMIEDIKAQGVNTILITEPFILTNSKTYQDAQHSEALGKTKDGKVKTYDFYFGNTALVDVFSKQGSDWFNKTYQKLSQQGVTGWWGDLGEPEVHPSDLLHTLDDGTQVNADAVHNVYGHQWAKNIFNHQLALNPEQRPFILMRSGFAGSQRYGMIPWTGDVSQTWGGLKPQVELSLQMSLLGMAYTHSDLGGFVVGDTFDKELYIRWLQYGVFQPIYRPHAQDKFAAEIIYHDDETQNILRNFIKLRYNLLPYNYSLAYQNSTTGMPLMRPLFFEYEGENEPKNTLNLQNNTKSYLWGDAFLVTPIVDAGVNSVPVTLPKGVWFDYFTGKAYEGKQTVDIPVTLETLPVLVRAGSFIPMIDDIQSTQHYDSSKLTLHYYADKSVNTAQGQMYEDDGKTYQANEKGLFELLTFNAAQNQDKLAIILAHSGKGYPTMPKQREMSLVIHHWEKQPKTINVNNKQADNALWDKKHQTLTIKFLWQHQPLTLSIQ